MISFVIDGFFFTIACACDDVKGVTFTDLCLSLCYQSGNLLVELQIGLLILCSGFVVQEQQVRY